jgi:hypothetical protein
VSRGQRGGTPTAINLRHLLAKFSGNLLRKRTLPTKYYNPIFNFDALKLNLVLLHKERMR